MKVENNITGSIKYALREILMVVAGILIAVSINNWNEKRKQKNELENILSTIKDDIKNDIEEIEEVFSYYNKADTMFRRVMHSELVAEDYVKNPRLRFLILGFPEVSYNSRGIDLLKDFKSDNKIFKQSIVSDITDFYTERMLEIKVDEDLRADDFKENFAYWKNNTEWWGDYISDTDPSGFIDYALNSNDYRNRVTTSYFYTYTVYLPELVKFKEQGLEIVDRIENQ